MMVYFSMEISIEGAKGSTENETPSSSTSAASKFEGRNEPLLLSTSSQASS
jgi:hypothetical protein